MKSIDSLRALTYRPYRRLFIGAVISNIGTWIETVTIGIYMQTVTHNASYVAAVLAVGFIPQALMGLFSGSIVDRFPRKRVLVTTNIWAACVSATLAVAIIKGFAHPWFVISLIFFAGFLNAVTWPAWQAFMSDIVPKDKVPGALTLLFAQWNMGRIVGPAFAALFLLSGNYSLALIINTCSFLVVVAMILLVKDSDYQDNGVDLKEVQAESAKSSLTAGWKFILSKTSGVRTPYLVYAITIFWASPFIALLPNVADEVFKYKNLGTALFTTAQGIGAVTVSVFLTTLHVKYGPTRTQQAFLITLPFVLICFGLAPNIVFATPIALFFGMTYLGTLTSTTLAGQLAAPPELKGRVSAAFMATLGFLFPLASLLQSVFLEKFGSTKLFTLSGTFLLVVLIAVGALKKSYHLPHPYSFDESDSSPSIIEVAGVQGE